MLKELVAVFCLVIVCNAADPTPPNIPETFVATVQITVSEGNRQEEGTGRWCSSATAKKSLRNDTTTTHDSKHSMEYFLALELFSDNANATGVGYHVRPNRDGKDEECTSTPLKGPFRGLFDWVKHARYGGNETVRHRTLEIWDLKVTADLFRLGVDPETDRSVPVFIEEETGDVKRYVVFSAFDAHEPEETCFTVPRICQTPPSRHY